LCHAGTDTTLSTNECHLRFPLDTAATKISEKNSSNPSAAWVIRIVWVPFSLAAFCLSPIRTIIGRVMFTASPGETEAIIDLRLDGTAALAKRNDAIRPANAKRRDVKRILNVAALHFEELAGLWEEIHGKA
jgi:hypothetical protein